MTVYSDKYDSCNKSTNSSEIPNFWSFHLKFFIEFSLWQNKGFKQ